MSKLKDLTGQQFGQLTVLERADNHFKPNGKRVVRWLCQCKCGNTTITTTDNLVGGHTKSCGCLRHTPYTMTHGETNTRLYKIWIGMKNRCDNPNNYNYVNYGGRGIKVCDEWDVSYEAFRDWALSNGYTDRLTIDREDCNGDYEPLNCRWVNNKKQANNRRSNKYITFDGETHTLSEWGDITGIKPNTIRMRLDVYGYTVEEALNLDRYTTPTKAK